MFNIVARVLQELAYLTYAHNIAYTRDLDAQFKEAGR
jgi:hypothetical protein